MTTKEFGMAVEAFVQAYRSGEHHAEERTDAAYDEWLEENLDRFPDDDSERDFAQWKNESGVKPRDSKDVNEIARLWEEYSQSRADDEDWVTIKGTHVLLNENGEAQSGGKLKGMTFSKAQSQKKKPKAPAHNVVHGKDMTAGYSGDGTISSVIHDQGFDGPPKLVTQEEFDKAVKASGMVAQRVYAASSQEALDAYREALYGGKWYVECTVGGSQFGQGMYTASNYSGNLTNEIQEQIDGYKKQYLTNIKATNKYRGKTDEPAAYVEDITLDPSAKVADYDEMRSLYFGIPDKRKIKQIKDDVLDRTAKEIREKYGEAAETYVRGSMDIMSVGISKYMETMDAFDDETMGKLDMFVNRAKVEVNKKTAEYKNDLRKKSDEISEKFDDIGSYVAACGYDAMRVNFPDVTKEDTSYTVIYNRTKVIIRDGRNHTDSADGGDISFRPGKDGKILAVRDGKVIGWVLTNDYQSPAEGRGDSDDDEMPEDLLEDLPIDDDILGEEEENWITVNGAHVLLNEEGEAQTGGDLKGMDFSKAKSEHPIEWRPTPPVGQRSAKDFLPKDSYRDTQEFKDAVAACREADEKDEKLWGRMKELEEAMKGEQTPKPRNEWDDNDELEYDVFHKKPMVYTEKGKKLKKEYEEARHEWHKAKTAEDKAWEKLDEMKKAEHERQLEAYEQKPLKPATKKDYEGFRLDKTCNSFGDEYLENGKGTIVEMSPREYLERCAYEIFPEGTMESTMGAVNEESAKKYAEQMKNGTKFDLPYLNYKDSGQEGRHRAVAAYMAGIETIPVLIIGKPSRKDEDDKGRWITTDNGHKVHLNEEGEPDKGNPKVIEKMQGQDKESRIKQLEAQLAEAKGLITKGKIKTEIEMLKADWPGTKEEWLAHQKQEREEAYRKSIERQAKEKAEKEAKAEAERKQLELEMRTQPKEKVAQYEIIQKTNPMLDDYHVGIRKPSDIKTWDEVLAEDDGESFAWGDFTKADAEKAQRTGSIRVYSSYPIKQGVFVSTSKVQAQQYAGGEGGKVYSKTIPLSKVAWINGDEGQFADTSRKRMDEDDWVTIKGTHVLIDDEGVAQGGGKLKGIKFQNAKSKKRTGQNKAELGSPFDNEEFLKAAGDADDAVEFWMNLTPEQQKMVGKDYKKVYEQLKAKAGDTKPEWAPLHGKVSDMPTKMEYPGKPVSVVIKESQTTHTASAEGHNVVTLYKGHEYEWNEEVYIHELGHQLSNFGLEKGILQNPGGLWGRYNQKQKVFYGPGDDFSLSPEESFADCFRDYMVRPEKLKKRSKDAYEYFQRMEKDNPWVRDYVKRSLEEINRAVNAHMHKDSDDGRWITTENGHKVHINEKGVPDKGNRHVLEKMNDAPEFDPFEELMKAADEPDSQTEPEPVKREPVTGGDITDSYDGPRNLQGVLHAQGFDGLPRVVSREEFDEAVKASGFVAQRTYSASSEEVLDAYRKALYDGEFYVECEGGDYYGQGLYTVSDYTGNVTDEMADEIGKYSNRFGADHHYVETMTLSPDAKIGNYRELSDVYEGTLSGKALFRVAEPYMKEELDEIREMYGKDAETFMRWGYGDPNISREEGERAERAIGQDMADMLVCTDLEGYDKAQAFVRKRSDRLKAKFGDVGSYAAALGYDAYKCDIEILETSSYTVVLNRTKLILLDGRQKTDAADTGKGVITFRPGKKGRIEAVRNGRVVGWVMTNDYQSSPARRQDEEPAGWITLENGEHVPLNEEGEAMGGAGGWAKGKDFSGARKEPPRYGKAAGEKHAEIQSAFTARAEYTPADSFQEWQMANMKGRDNPTRIALSKLYKEEGIEGVQKEYYSSKTIAASGDIHEMSKDEADEAMYDAMPKNVFHGWFMEADSDYKPMVVDAVTSSPEARSAAMNLMYENYKYEGDGKLSFEEFLNTPVTMYRGGHGQEHVESDVFSSYSFSRKAAEKFAGSDGTVYEAKIRPIDTWGSVLENGESEILVPSWIAPNGNRDSAGEDTMMQVIDRIRGDLQARIAAPAVKKDKKDDIDSGGSRRLRNRSELLSAFRKKGGTDIKNTLPIQGRR